MIPQRISCAEYSVVQLPVIEAAQVIRKQRQFVRRKSNAEAAPVQEVGEWWLYTTRQARISQRASKAVPSGSWAGPHLQMLAQDHRNAAVEERLREPRRPLRVTTANWAEARSLHVHGVVTGGDLLDGQHLRVRMPSEVVDKLHPALGSAHR